MDYTPNFYQFGRPDFVEEATGRQLRVAFKIPDTYEAFDPTGHADDILAEISAPVTVKKGVFGPVCLWGKATAGREWFSPGDTCKLRYIGPRLARSDEIIILDIRVEAAVRRSLRSVTGEVEVNGISTDECEKLLQNLLAYIMKRTV